MTSNLFTFQILNQVVILKHQFRLDLTPYYGDGTLLDHLFSIPVFNTRFLLVQKCAIPVINTRFKLYEEGRI